ncbi:MAG TPA: hypothetical protein VIL85_13685 [Thermomicrobiales bacterium]|jgi:hypothetical protein
MSNKPPRDDKFSLACRLLGRGSFEVTLVTGLEEFTHEASYIADAVYELTEATIKVLLGYEQAACRWMQKPGELRWYLERDDDQLHLTVLEFERAYSTQEDVAGVPLFALRCGVRRFAVQVHSQLWRLSQTHRDGVYQKVWVPPFPQAGYERLGRLIRDDAGRDVSAGEAGG